MLSALSNHNRASVVAGTSESDRIVSCLKSALSRILIKVANTAVLADLVRPLGSVANRDVLKSGNEVAKGLP